MDPIRNFLDIYSNINTRNTYRVALHRFLEMVYAIERPRPGSPVDYQKYDQAAANYLQEVGAGRNPRNDLLAYVSSLSTAAPSTQRGYPSCIQVWLEFHDVPLPAKDRKMITRRSRPNVPAGEEEEYITHEILRKILEFSPPQLRAMTMVMAASGLRIDEALGIEVRDLDLKFDPAMIHIRPEVAKGGVGRKVFITSEARGTLEKWLEFRGQYISKKRGPRGKLPNSTDPRVFPFSDNAALQMWTITLRRAGLEKKDRTTNRLTIHPHGLRKFFRRVLPTGGSNAKAVELTEKLMGHAGYLGGVYSRVPLKELAEFYREAEHVLWVYQPVAIRDPLVEERLERARAENESLKSRLFEIETNQAEIAETLQGLSQIIDNNLDAVAPTLEKDGPAGTRTKASQGTPPPGNTRRRRGSP